MDHWRQMQQTAKFYNDLSRAGLLDRHRLRDLQTVAARYRDIEAAGLLDRSFIKSATETLSGIRHWYSQMHLDTGVAADLARVASKYRAIQSLAPPPDIMRALVRSAETFASVHPLSLDAPHLTAIQEAAALYAESGIAVGGGVDTQSDDIASSEGADAPEGIGDSAVDASEVEPDVVDAVIASAEVIVARAEAKPLLERVVEAATQLGTLFDLASYMGALDDDVRAAIEAAGDDVLSSMLDFARWVAGPTDDEDEAR